MHVDVRSKDRPPYRPGIFDHCAPALEQRGLQDRSGNPENFDLIGPRNDAKQLHLIYKPGGPNESFNLGKVIRLSVISLKTRANQGDYHAARPELKKRRQSREVIFVLPKLIGDVNELFRQPVAASYLCMKAASVQPEGAAKMPYVRLDPGIGV